MWLKKRGLRIELFRPADIAWYKQLGFVEDVEPEAPPVVEAEKRHVAAPVVDPPEPVADEAPDVVIEDATPADDETPAILSDEKPKKAVKK